MAGSFRLVLGIDCDPFQSDCVGEVVNDGEDLESDDDEDWVSDDDEERVNDGDVEVIDVSERDVERQHEA